MQVRLRLFLLDSVTISTISLKSLATWMPFPQFVFSPGFRIQIFFIGALLWWNSGASSPTLDSRPIIPISFGLSVFSGLDSGD